MGRIECGWATCDERGLVEKEGSTPLTESLEQANRFKKIQYLIKV